ncbi:MAG TPA: sugar transferase, partial [Gemmatimonadales bacterium]|nr:sugar transferase [Gemmatimonadales bacterium]
MERAGAGGGIPTIQRLWSAEGFVGTGAQDDPKAREQYLLCRSINFLLALVALILLFPILLLIALLVWLTSPGPILYTQVRVGLDRRVPIDASQNYRRQRDI